MIVMEKDVVPNLYDFFSYVEHTHTLFFMVYGDSP